MYILCTIADKTAEAFGQIVQFKNEAIAKREFSTFVNEQGSQINKFPEDFSLWLLAKYDEERGVIIALDKPKKFLEAKDLKIKK